MSRLRPMVLALLMVAAAAGGDEIADGQETYSYAPDDYPRVLELAPPQTGFSACTMWCDEHPYAAIVVNGSIVVEIDRDGYVTVVQHASMTDAEAWDYIEHEFTKQGATAIYLWQIKVARRAWECQ